MKKKYIFLTGFVVAATIVAFYFYDIIYLISRKDMRLRAVPIHTAFFADIQNWDEIQKSAMQYGFDRAAMQLNIFQKVLETEGVLKQLQLKDNPFITDMHQGKFLISYHVTKPGYTESLLVLELKNAKSPALKELMSTQATFTSEARKVRGEEVWDVSFGNTYGRWTLTITHGVLLMSHDPSLVEDGLLQLKDNVSIYTDGTFRQIPDTQIPYVHLYYHFSNLSSAAQAFADKSAFILSQPISRFADWMGVNLSINQNGIGLNGQATVNDKELRFLNDFAFNNKVKFYPLAQKPENTALLMSAILRRRDSKDMLKSSPVLSLPEFQTYVLPWFDEEATFVLTEPVGSNYDAHSLLFLKSKTSGRPYETLKPLFVNTDEANNRFPLNYKGNIICKLNTAGWYGMLLPNPFTEMLSPYILFTNDYVVLANSLTQLKLYVERLNDKKTLDKTIIPGMNTSSFTTGSFVVYTNLPLLNDLVENSVSKEFAASFSNEYNQIAKWSPLLLEYNYEDAGTFKVSGVIVNKTSQAPSESNYLWKTELDTLAASPPYVVIDKQGKEKRVLVQDVNNKLYMINRAGDIVWRRNINSPLKGEIRTIDFYKNNEYQIILATEDKIYVMDESGNDLPNFPITLPFKAVTGLSVFDPDGSRNYLYFIGCENGYYYGYEKSGRPLSGWNPNPNGKNIAMPVSYYHFKNKEFFMLITGNGILKLYSRYGKEVYKELKTNTVLTRPFVSVNNKGFVTCNPSGETFFLGYDGKLIKTNALIPDCLDAMYANLTSLDVPDLICLTPKDVSVYRYDSTFIFRYNFKSMLSDASMSMLNGIDIQPCVIVNDHDMIFPINTKGELAKHFPKKGMNVFVGTDLYNNGAEVLIGLLDESTIVTYPVEW